MSADKRKTILIGFAGLAVVLVAVIAIVSPSFRSEDATGAIGAVQKHRAPQITKQDVVLGNEAVKQEQKVVYADYVSDATALKSFALNVSDATVQAKMDAMKADIATRFANDYELALRLAGKLAESESIDAKKRAAAQAEINDLGVIVRRARFDQKEMENLSLRLNKLAESFDLAQLTRFQAVNLASADVNTIDAMLRSVDTSNLAAMLQFRTEYAGAMVRESKLLAREEAQFAAKLSAEADELGSIARANMKEYLSRESDEIGVLTRAQELLSQLQGKTVASESELFNKLNSQLRSQVAQREASCDAMIRDKATFASMLNSEEFSTQAQTLFNEAEGLAAKVRR